MTATIDIVLFPSVALQPPLFLRVTDMLWLLVLMFRRPIPALLALMIGLKL
jgi:hypothetical protein